MGLWSGYFLVKFLLYLRGDIDFDPWLNVAFAAFTALTPGNGRQRFAKNLIALPLGVLLLYHDSWLPSITQLLAPGHALHAASPSFLWELILRALNWKMVIEIVALSLLYAVARRTLRLSTFVFLGILVISVVPAVRSTSAKANNAAPGQMSATGHTGEASHELDPRNLRSADLDARLLRFYADQRAQQVRFAHAGQEGAPFDIILIHVSSLSWDDLRAVNADKDPLLGRFDILLTNFNSAAIDALPAAMRWLLGLCGQVAERQLYEAAPRECRVVDGLRAAGFEPHWLTNQGRNDDVAAAVNASAQAPLPQDPVTGAAVAQRAADGLPIYDDYSVLSRWWARRQTDGAAQVALYYNSYSLHDGNRALDRTVSGTAYATQVAQLSSDVRRFLGDLERSGRHVIVVFVAEHGAAVRGDQRQMAGVREIPTASIATVPVGIALINAPPSAPSTQQRIDAPTSYLAVNELLARFIADDPFDKQGLSLQSYVQTLPQTEFVAESNGTTVMRIDRHDLMRSPDGSWSSLETSN